MPRQNLGPRLEPNERGFIEIRWTENGRSRRSSTGTKDAAKAQEVFRQWMTLEATDPVPSLTVEALLEHYKQGHADRNVSASLTSDLAIAHVKAALGDLDVKDLGPEDIYRYEAERAAGAVGWTDDEGKRRGYHKAASSSVRREVAVLVAAVNYGVKNRLLSKADVRELPLPQSGEARERWLTRDEAKRLLETAEARRKGPGRSKVEQKRLSRAERFIYLGLYTAARKNALETLKWEQVSFEQGTINLNPAGRRQTKKRRPIIPISAHLRPILQRMADERKSDWVLDHSGDIRTTFERTVAAAGVEGVSPHILRHTAATWMVQAGVSFERVARFLGTTVAMVERVYGHHAPDFLQDAANGLGAILEESELLK
jgi:integrase